MMGYLLVASVIPYGTKIYIHSLNMAGLAGVDP